MKNTQQISPRQGKTRGRRTAPLPSVHRLKSVSVIGGFLDGVQFDLADGLNGIIGARGTGKTTALELVRFAIDALPTREANPAEHKRIESLVEQNLAGGRVEVKVETKDGLQYTITRSWGEEPIVLSADGSPTAISLAGSGIFKADVFSQNEVEQIANRVASQLALVDNFESEAIAQIDTELKQVQLMLTANASRITPLHDKLAALADDLNTLPSVEEKLKKFSPAEGEDSTEINRAHALKALRDRERRAIDGAGEILRTTACGLQNLIGQIDRRTSMLIGPDIADGPNGEMIRDIVQGLSECGQQVDRLLEQAQSRIVAEQEELAPERSTTANRTSSHCWKEARTLFECVEKGTPDDDDDPSGAQPGRNRTAFEADARLDSLAPEAGVGRRSGQADFARRPVAREDCLAAFAGRGPEVRGPEGSG